MQKFLIDRILKDTKYNKREAAWLHIPYEYELSLLNMVKNGNAAGLRNAALPFEQRAHLSENELWQKRYELAALITLVTRWAVEGGLDVESAYDLSDAYINAASQTDDRETVRLLMQEAPLHFAALVQANKRQYRLPKPVLQCMEYIESNLHSAITMAQLAEYTRRNASYLSTLFKKEVGMPISAYILQKRLAEARQLLTDTDMPIAQIAGTLAFSTQSYFSKVFFAHNGETPGQYRKRFFRIH